MSLHVDLIRTAATLKDTFILLPLDQTFEAMLTQEH